MKSYNHIMIRLKNQRIYFFILKTNKSEFQMFFSANLKKNFYNSNRYIHFLTKSKKLLKNKQN